MSEASRLWEQVRLGDLLKVKHGFAFKGDGFTEPTGDIVLTPGNFLASGGLVFRPEKDRSYSQTYPREFRLAAGDLVIVMTDLTQEARILGSAAFVPAQPGCLHNQRLGKIIDLDTSRIDRRYLYFVLNERTFRESIKATATGSTVRHTSPGRIEAFEFSLPPLGDQRRITSILGAYDDLIEVNRRRIAVLEEMARRLFEEWFVHFRFPGHAGATRSEPGLPAGWRRAPISSAYDGLFDGPHATPAPAQEGPVFLGIGNITEAGRLDLASVRPIAEAEFAAWTKRVTPREGDIVFSYEATLNRYALIPPGFRGCLGRRLALIRATRPGMARYLFRYFFTEGWRHLIAANTLSGATVQRIPLTRFPSFEVLLPPEELIARHEAMAEPLGRQVDVLELANARLTASRDLLLPRLISGDLPVTAAERELEAVA